MTAPKAREPLVVAALVAIGAGLYGWALFVLSFRHDGLIGPRYNAPGIDFMVFWEAARAALAGNLALLNDGARFTARLNADFGHWLTAPLPLHPWIYPPHFLLLVVAFGLMPFAAAYALFIAGAFALAVSALLAGERGERRLVLGGALALSPAAAIDAVAGQNAFLTAALLIGGMRLAVARPLAGGALLSLLTVKPQLFLMVPVALAAARQGRALAACFATAAALVAASAAVFGVGPWQDWLAALVDPANEVHRGWTALSLLWGESVYSDALLLGASPALAQGAEVAAFVLAALAVAWAYARGAALRLPVLLAASVLAAPHVAPYDTLLVGLAAALFFAQALERGFGPCDLPLALALFLMPLYGAPMLSPAGFAAPVLLLLFLARAAAQPP
jgi:alpha-1,2-mannosyltransferase